VTLAVLLATGTPGCASDAKQAGHPSFSAGARRGRQVVAEKGCATCHTVDGSRSTGPTWKGLAGSKVKLEGGTTRVADEAYLRKAITEPKSETVAGFANTMPSYSGLTDAEVDDLIAYLQALSGQG